MNILYPLLFQSSFLQVFHPSALGLTDGTVDGILLRLDVGCNDGSKLGLEDGCVEGILLGFDVGSSEG